MRILLRFCPLAAVALVGSLAGTPISHAQPPVNSAGQFNRPRSIAPGPQAFQPAWIPLLPAHQQHVDNVLQYWEQHSRRIERYRCQFTRFEYDAQFGPKPDAQTREPRPKTVCYGSIKYAAPDKGLFRVERITTFQPAQAPNQQSGYVESPNQFGEYWVCDGKSIFEFDHLKRQLIQYSLPPQMQGTAITNGPLPFLFGAETEKIKERFWVRTITPATMTSEQWLEAVPKYREDASNFQMVHIFIDQETFLPKGIRLFPPEYDAARNPSYTTYLFENRETNWNVTLQRLNLFHREFFEPAVPKGWQKVVKNAEAESDQRAGPPAAATGTAPRQTQRPGDAGRTRR